MMGAVSALGAHVETHGNHWRIRPARAHTETWKLPTPVTIDCGLAGTVMRFMPIIAALIPGPVQFDADEQAYVRPMAHTIATLRQLGVHVEDDGRDTLPFTVHGIGSVSGGQIHLNSSASSQFVSALLLAAAEFTDGLTITNTGAQLPSLTHINMTVNQLRNRGVHVDDTSTNRWQVFPGPIQGAEIDIEPDLSNAGPFIAAGLVTGGSMTIQHWPELTDQPGQKWLDIIAAFGGHAERDGNAMVFSAGRQLHGVDLDLHGVGELTPVIAAIASLAHSPSQLHGIAHLRGHETNRLEALSTELNKLGSHVTQCDDGLHIDPRPMSGGTFATYSDHRMAHAAAVIGLQVPDLLVEDIKTTDKTYPGFAPAWERLVRP